MGTICRICDIQGKNKVEVIDGEMCCGAHSGRGFQRARSFLTKEERIELLKEYKQDLERESQGVAERIKELEAAVAV